MARTALTAQVADRDGLAVSFASANADGHSFANNGRRALHFKNTDASAVTGLTVALIEFPAA